MANITRMYQPPLFELGARSTTRQIAALVKAGGVHALPSPEVRAGEVRYQDIQCRSALNAASGMPFTWTLNAYRGCTHACAYCFARRYQSQLELGAGDDFSRVILVKRNIAEVLEREVDRPAWRRGLVAVGTATDPYQPVEGEARLTRACLEVLARARVPVGLVTKGPMVVRDIDVLAAMSAQGEVTVYVSLPTVDEAACARLEPGAAPPAQRLRALRRLLDAGVRAGALMSPLVPGFSTQPARLEATVRALADRDIPLLGGNVLYLEGGTRAHFFAFLEREAPHLRDKYARIYRSVHAAPEYASEVRRVLRLVRQRYGMERPPAAGTRQADGIAAD